MFMQIGLFYLYTFKDSKWYHRLIASSSRHWIAIKKINGAYYNLDSRLDQPQKLTLEEV